MIQGQHMGEPAFGLTTHWCRRGFQRKGNARLPAVS